MRERNKHGIYLRYAEQLLLRRHAGRYPDSVEEQDAWEKEVEEVSAEMLHAEVVRCLSSLETLARTSA